MRDARKSFPFDMLFVYVERTFNRCCNAIVFFIAIFAACSHSTGEKSIYRNGGDNNENFVLRSFIVSHIIM